MMMGGGGAGGMPGGMSGRGAPGGMMMGGGGGAGGMPGGMSGRGAPGGMMMGGGGAGGMPGGMSGRGAPGGMMGGMGMMGGRGMGGGGMGGGAGGQGAAARDELDVTQKGSAVEIDLNLVDNDKSRGLLERIASEHARGLRANFAIQMARPAIHRLAEALMTYVRNKHGEFPRGTHDRGQREGIELPYAPTERCSWLYDLLEPLGHDDIAISIDPKAGWNDSHNLPLAVSLVPEFIDPRQPPASWFIHYAGAALPTTHFVGIAGVGLDAAEPGFRANPANAKKLGVFSYDDATRLNQIADGPANTIAMIQVSPEYLGAWLAGGGGSVRGVPETGSVKPFVCTMYHGKPGTFAIMCDGKVRFIPETTPDETFKALCTIRGGEQVENLDRIAPVVGDAEAPAKAPAKGGEGPKAATTAVPTTETAAVTGATPNPLQAAAEKMKRGNDLKQIVLGYLNCLDATNKPPASDKDLAAYVENPPLLAAVREGRYVVYWGVDVRRSTAGTSNTVLAYEKEVPSQGGQVAMADGSLKLMTPEEFAKATKAGK
jgi:hypothetical protein